MTNKPTQDELAAILKKHRKWRLGQEGGERANLGRAYLGGANLGGANLGDANLGGANLGRAYLGGAYLGGANLGGAYLGGANLGRAYLGGAYLGDANLGRAYLGGAYLRDAYLGGANLRGANLGDANLRGASLYRTIGNGEEMVSLQVRPWLIVWTALTLSIGCEQHPIEDWWAFDDDRIASMESRALDWWRENKDWLRATVERWPAKPTGREGEGEGSNDDEG